MLRYTCTRRGHLSQGKTLMTPYLPRAGASTTSPFSEGGALWVKLAGGVCCGVCPDFMCARVRSLALPGTQLVVLASIVQHTQHNQSHLNPNLALT